VVFEVSGAAKGAPLQQLQQRELNVLNVLIVAGREGLAVLGRSLSAGRRGAHVVHDCKHAQVAEGHRVIVELLGGEEEAAEQQRLPANLREQTLGRTQHSLQQDREQNHVLLRAGSAEEVDEQPESSQAGRRDGSCRCALCFCQELRQLSCVEVQQRAES